MVMISERPADVADRAVPGRWERELMMGARNQSAILTLVERSTRYVLLGHLPGGHTAEAVRDVLATLIGTLPEHLRRSLTWDQGAEMAEHRAFSIATTVPVYFCDPPVRGSADRTRTPMGSCASTSPRGPIWPSTARRARARVPPPQHASTQNAGLADTSPALAAQYPYIRTRPGVAMMRRCALVRGFSCRLEARVSQ